MSEKQRDEQLMTALLGKLYRILTGGVDGTTPSQNSFIAWCTPGIPFAPKDFEFLQRGVLAGSTGEETREILSQAAAFATIANFVPDASGVFDTELKTTTLENSGQLLWRQYEAALKFSQVAAVEMSKKEEKKLKHYRSLMRQEIKVKHPVTKKKVKKSVDGDLKRLYNNYSAKYDEAAAEFSSKYLQANNSESSLAVQDWAMNGARYKRKLQRAMDEWISEGYKNDYEAMLADINNITQRNLQIWKRQMQATFEKAKRTDLRTAQDFYPTFLVPHDFASQKAWTKFAFSSAHEKSYSHSETNTWDVTATARWGLLSGSVSSTGRLSKTRSKVDMNNFQMSFELVQVPISRPWFAPEFLTSPGWRFQPGLGQEPLSDGGKPPKGRLVAYPTTAVFARNITASFDELKKDESTRELDLTVKANVSYGPFSLSGTYGRNERERSFESTVEDGTLHVPGMQLIALKCAVLPQSPNPSSDITTWG